MIIISGVIRRYIFGRERDYTGSQTYESSLRPPSVAVAWLDSEALLRRVRVEAAATAAAPPDPRCVHPGARWSRVRETRIGVSGSAADTEARASPAHHSWVDARHLGRGVQPGEPGGDAAQPFQACAWNGASNGGFVTLAV